MCEFFYWTFSYCHEIVAWGVGVPIVLVVVFVIASLWANSS